MTGSILQKLLALYFAIIRSWQLSSSDKPLVAKQNSSIYLKDFTNLDFFFHFFHFLFIFCDKSLFTLSVTQSACCFLSTLGLETPEQNDFDQFWKFKFNFKHFPRSTQFLSFDGSRNYLNLFKNHWQTFLWPGKRLSCHFRVTKMWFGPNIKYRSEFFFVDFYCWKGIFCLILSEV